ncbi:hypothetical protein IEQ34_013739 [Dendrobium chrysotoxum]|uniref:Uncharacterized protein n=1 Tax=Dendrobium chrysotoxum TaxID=161865 RepID=A0AAV7GRQ3_DENCH|nr:hypothetical protein IEQ34_013739 [Dendrobium chrysotoxum]
MLAEEGLMPEDGNFEANEKVFKTIMGPEHPGRVRTQGFGITPSRYFPHSTTTPGSNNGGNNAFDRVVRLEEVVQTLQSEVRQFMKNYQGHHPPSGSSTMSKFTNNMVMMWRNVVLSILIIELLGKFTSTVRLSWKLWLASMAIALLSCQFSDYNENILFEDLELVKRTSELKKPV